MVRFFLLTGHNALPLSVFLCVLLYGRTDDVYSLPQSGKNVSKGMVDVRLSRIPNSQFPRGSVNMGGLYPGPRVFLFDWV